MARGDQNNVAGVSSTDWRRRTKPRPRQSGRCPYRGGVVCPRLKSRAAHLSGACRWLASRKIVSAHLGPGRVRGNESGACFSRQVSMYLGLVTLEVGVPPESVVSTMGGTTRPFSTASRKSSGFEELTNLWTRCLDVLADELGRQTKPILPNEKRKTWREALVDSVIARIAEQARAQSVLCARCLAPILGTQCPTDDSPQKNQSWDAQRSVLLGHAKGEDVIAL